MRVEMKLIKDIVCSFAVVLAMSIDISSGSFSELWSLNANQTIFIF